MDVSISDDSQGTRCTAISHCFRNGYTVLRMVVLVGLTVDHLEADSQTRTQPSYSTELGHDMPHTEDVAQLACRFL